MDNDNRIPYIFRDHECCNQIRFFMAIKEEKSNPFLMFTLERGLEMTVCNLLNIMKQLSNLNKPNFANIPYQQKTLNPKPRSWISQPPLLLPAVPPSAVQCSFTARDLSAASRVMVIQLSTVCLLNYFAFVFLFTLLWFWLIRWFPFHALGNFPISQGLAIYFFAMWYW